jgi:pimeloyl-ACP methyl ester carboxylesterase
MLLAFLLTVTFVPLVHTEGEQAANLLPAPRGPFPVGRETIHLVDRSRIEPLSADHRFREIMMDVWYPATASNRPPAEYVNLVKFEAALGDSGMRNLFGSAAPLIKAGRIRTHAIDGVPFAKTLRRCPLVIFSHGMGTVSRIYTAQLEDLASHGYVVAALTHTYDAALTVFPDGRNIVIDMAGRPRQGSSEEEQIAYENQRIEWWASDIRFALGELSRINREQSSRDPFAGHLDLTSVAAFGHSNGGEAAARACQLDSRFKACLNQDGIQRFAPFHLDSSGWGMDQSFLLIARIRKEPPSEKELAEMHMTLSEVQDLVARLRAAQERALQSIGGGSYRVFLNYDATTHMSFSDLPVLQATNPAEAEARTRVLETILDYDRAFFDKTLRSVTKTELDDPQSREFVDSVQKFPPATKPRN